MSRLFALTIALVLAVVPACGGGSDDATSGTVAAGPLVMAIPNVPVGTTENLVVGLQNLTTATATVYLRAYTEAGTPYLGAPSTVILPPQGGTKEALAGITGGFATGGWVEIETRDITALDGSGVPTPTATSGFVAAYVERFANGVESDATSALSFRDDLAFVNVTQRTLSYQIINRSYVPGAGGAMPAAASFTVTTYDEFATVLSSVVVPVPANGSVSALGSVITGRVEVTPASAAPGTLYLFGISSREQNPAEMIEGRFLNVPRPLAQRDAGYDLEFGTDGFGNVYDFAFVLTNPTSSNENVQLRSIYRADGFPILDLPTVIGVDAKSTKYLATTYADSRGLDTGEVNPFAEIFTNIAGGFETFTVDFSASASIAISAREFPAQFLTWFRILPGRKLTTDAIVLGVSVPSETNLGVRNFIVLMNPGTSDRSINIRGFTPGGTEYNLDEVVVGARQRVDWSPDGNIWREEPSDTTGPAVPFMSFRFSSNGGIYVDARRVRYGPVTSEILSMRPHAWRDLRAN